MLVAVGIAIARTLDHCTTRGISIRSVFPRFSNAEE